MTAVGMTLPDLGHLVRGMTIARSDLAQVLSRHAIQPVDCLAMFARRHQQIVERRPVVSPVEIEANSLPEFLCINLAPPPFVEDVLVAREDGFDSKNHRPIPRLGALLQQSCGKTLRRRQGMVVADEHDVGVGNRSFSCS